MSEVIRLVVGLDATPHDDAVIDWASRFATEHRGQINVVHVIPRTVLWMLAGVQTDSNHYLINIRAHFEREIVSQLRDQGLAVRLWIRLGDPAHQLAQVAADVNADLIVIGGPEHHALHDVIMGGAAHRLERGTDIPVVVVPQHAGNAHART